MKKVLFLFAALAIVFWLSQIDDKINPKITTLTKYFSSPDESKAYLYLLGIDASEGEDPLIFGKAQLEKRKEAEKHINLLDELNYNPPVTTNTLPELEEAVACKLSQYECLEKYFNEFSDSKHILEKHSTLLNRYKKFIQFDEYTTQTKPTNRENFPAYGLLIDANRLFLLDAIYSEKNENSKQATQKILSNIQLLRKSLIHQDNLIGKMIFLIMLSDNLDVLLNLKYRFNNIEKIQIANLSAMELSLKRAIDREIMMGLYIFPMLDKQPNLFSHEFKIPAWLARLSYKPNMTQNQHYALFQQEKNIIENTHTAKEWSKLAERNINKKLFSIRNFAGNLLVQTAAPSYFSYKERFIHLDNKISLVNQSSLLESPNLNIKNIPNPFFPENKSVFLSENKQQICFERIFTNPIKPRLVENCVYLPPKTKQTHQLSDKSL